MWMCPVLSRKKSLIMSKRRGTRESSSSQRMRRQRYTCHIFSEIYSPNNKYLQKPNMWLFKILILYSSRRLRKAAITRRLRKKRRRMKMRNWMLTRVQMTLTQSWMRKVHYCDFYYRVQAVLSSSVSSPLL